MLDPNHPITELLQRDERYHFDAYVFVFDALRYAQEKLHLGRAHTSAPQAIEELEGSELEDGSLEESEHDEAGLSDDAADDAADITADITADDGPDTGAVERHVTGQELCEAIRRYALEQYGLMAKNVLNHWGITSTGDFGEIVFNLIEIGQMRKTPHDRRQDFDNVFQFDDGLRNGFEICQPDSSEEHRP